MLARRAAPAANLASSQLGSSSPGNEREAGHEVSSSQTPYRGIPAPVLSQHIDKSSAVAMICTNPAGKIQEVNPATVTMFKCHDEKDLRGRTIASLRINPSPEEELPRREKSRRVEGRRADGSSFPAHLVTTPLRAENGQRVTHVVAHITDMTEQVELEQVERERVAEERHSLEKCAVCLEGLVHLHLDSRTFVGPDKRMDNLLGMSLEDMPIEEFLKTVFGLEREALEDKLLHLQDKRTDMIDRQVLRVKKGTSPSLSSSRPGDVLYIEFLAQRSKLNSSKV